MPLQALQLGRASTSAKSVPEARSAQPWSTTWTSGSVVSAVQVNTRSQARQGASGALLASTVRLKTAPAKLPPTVCIVVQANTPLQ